MSFKPTVNMFEFCLSLQLNLDFDIFCNIFNEYFSWNS